MRMGPTPASKWDPPGEAMVPRGRRHGMGYSGYLSFWAELLFQAFADRYERASLLITSNLAFADWVQVFSNSTRSKSSVDQTGAGLLRAFLGGKRAKLEKMKR